MAPFDTSLVQFGGRADELRQHLYFADSASLGATTRHAPMAQLRAACYVWLAAAAERFVDAFVDELLDTVNAANIAPQELRLTLFAMNCASELDRLQDVRGLRMWNERAGLFKMVDEVAPRTINMHHKPLDGRTLGPEHVETLWGVFGFSGEPFPSPRHRLSLLELSLNRNKLAHGEADPVSFGRLKTFDDVQRTIRAIEDLVVHLADVGVTYLSSRSYLR